MTTVKWALCLDRTVYDCYRLHRIGLRHSAYRVFANPLKAKFVAAQQFHSVGLAN